MLTPKERLKNIFEGEPVDRPACICPGRDDEHDHNRSDG